MLDLGDEISCLNLLETILELAIILFRGVIDS